MEKNISSEADRIKEAVQMANQCTLDMADEKLKAVAFEQVLNHLLQKAMPLSQKNSRVQESNFKEKVEAGATKKPAAKQGPKAWLIELHEENFFVNPQSSKSIIQELANRSHHVRPTDLTGQLANLCHGRLLRRKKMAGTEGGKSVYHWSNWS